MSEIRRITQVMDRFLGRDFHVQLECGHVVILTAVEVANRGRLPKELPCPECETPEDAFRLASFGVH